MGGLRLKRAIVLLVPLLLALVPASPGGASAVEAPRPVTVIAIVDSGFSPYHFDFVGHQHPWNRDADPANDLDLSADPSTYIPGHPGGTAVPLTLPTSASEDVSVRRAGVDKAAWDAFPVSTAATPRVAWFPGTKVVAALDFGGTFYAGNDGHGTRSAASAAGNWHGTCPECLVVLVRSGGGDAGLVWALSQPWIDVVSNSNGSGSIVQGASGGNTRDNMYWRGPVNEGKAATEAGQVVLFSAGNGLANAFDAPQVTYWSSQKGPDWIVTVGAVTALSEQSFTGSGKPVDISSIGSPYPSTGGITANGTGSHSGTSNAAPTVAGYFGKVLQKARETLGDVTPGHAAGVVASGAPVSCGAAVPGCALADGVLTRAELQDLVFHNVLPGRLVAVIGTVPTTGFAYSYVGHGVLSGRRTSEADHESEWTQMVQNMLGNVASPTRPIGETNWFIVDSKCRQRIWGSWSEGAYRGVEPALGLPNDGPAMALDAACKHIPPRPFPRI